MIYITCILIISGAYTRQKERRMKMLRHRKSSTGATHRDDDAAAQKVLKVRVINCIEILRNIFLPFDKCAPCTTHTFIMGDKFFPRIV